MLNIHHNATIKISIGSDHGGKNLRKILTAYLIKKGYTLIDHGSHSNKSVDYPDYAYMVSKDITIGKANYGILVCTTGIGVSISANKFSGIRAALIYNEDVAFFSRTHNNANIICLGEKYITPYLGIKLINIFIHTPFEGGRHEKRLIKITKQE